LSCWAARSSSCLPAASRAHSAPSRAAGCATVGRFSQVKSPEIRRNLREAWWKGALKPVAHGVKIAKQTFEKRLVGAIWVYSQCTQCTTQVMMQVRQRNACDTIGCIASTSLIAFLQQGSRLTRCARCCPAGAAFQHAAMLVTQLIADHRPAPVRAPAPVQQPRDEAGQIMDASNAPGGLPCVRVGRRRVTCAANQAASHAQRINTILKIVPFRAAPPRLPRIPAVLVRPRTAPFRAGSVAEPEAPGQAPPHAAHRPWRSC
jgi:hypothetical protein